MHFNLLPLKLYRANRVMDFGDGWLTRIGEVLLLPDSQGVRDLDKLGAIEPVTLREGEEWCHEEKNKYGVISSFLRRFGL